MDKPRPVPSFSISASDCSHGDLGRITNKDILILISYSGNTEETLSGISDAIENNLDWMIKGAI